MGTWTHENASLLAGALARLGTERALVFSSRDGLDELTTTDVNIVNEVAGGRIRLFEIDSISSGLARASSPSLQAASLDDAVRIAREVLAGVPGPCRDVCLLNAAAGLWIAEAAGAVSEGLDLAARAIDSGAAARTLHRFVQLSNEP
jgi:anthranilate phosphoribosyltransferase